jgi:DNA adenine methylase
VGVKRAAPLRSATSTLVHFTPLRYPGGKGKLALFVKALLESNELLDGEYAEPYAGGAAIGLELLFHEYVSKIHINDISRPVFAFWKSVLEHTDELIRLVCDARLTVRTWDRHKAVLKHADEHDDLTLGFAMFFLNRTNRSGILNGGIIGGRDQTGPWKIDARYNAPELARRIEAIARLRRRIVLTRLDAHAYVKSLGRILPGRSLVYLDPPYYVQGKQLYHHYYSDADHAAMATVVSLALRRQRWIVSYDDTPEIRTLYRPWRRMTYSVGYSARETRQGKEVMFFDNELVVPKAVGAMKQVGRLASGLREKRGRRGSRPDNFTHSTG